MIRPDLPERLNVGVTAYSDYSSLRTFPDYNIKGAPEQKADLVAQIERIDFRRPKMSERFPIANLDAPLEGPIGPMVQARRDDFMSD
ncbi:hypothetical protein [Sodalis sp. dw_96]|uniref:hypothetical protein n=1 Tax=Sodalis sp. dw_96 TaxID=2719794 RepID=UPI001BD5551A|nr:hypothetical protein [Sodalis sp. dw_96]